MTYKPLNVMIQELSNLSTKILTARFPLLSLQSEDFHTDIRYYQERHLEYPGTNDSIRFYKLSLSRWLQVDQLIFSNTEIHWFFHSLLSRRKGKIKLIQCTLYIDTIFYWSLLY